MQIDLSIYDATLIPAIMFILYIIGNAGLPKRFLPVVALILGIIAGLIFIGFSPQGFIAGVLLALTVVGSHSGSKNVLQAIKGADNGLESLVGNIIEIPLLGTKYKVNSIGASGALQVEQVTSGLS